MASPAAGAARSAGIDALIRHGVAVHAVHVVTAENVEQHRGDARGAADPRRRIDPRDAGDRDRRRGAPGRLAGGVDVGSSGAIESFRAKHGDEVHGRCCSSGEGGVRADPRRRAPAALLVRPNGMVRADSLTPFTFGHVARRRARRPAGSASASIGAIPRSPAGRSRSRRRPTGRGPAWSPTSTTRSTSPRRAAERAPAAAIAQREVPAPVPAGARRAAASTIRGVRRAALRCSRRYRLGDVRVGGSPDRRMVRRLADGRIWRLNESASIVFDALCGGSPADAAGALADGVPLAPGRPARRGRPRRVARPWLATASSCRRRPGPSSPATSVRP